MRFPSIVLLSSATLVQVKENRVLLLISCLPSTTAFLGPVYRPRALIAMNKQCSGLHGQDTPPNNNNNNNRKMGSTLVTATEALQTAVKAMAAAAETLREQAQRLDEQTANPPTCPDLVALDRVSSSLWPRQDLTASRAADNADKNSGSLATGPGTEAFEPLDPPVHWPLSVAPEDSTRTLCPVEHVLEVEARYAPDLEDDEGLSRLTTVGRYHRIHTTPSSTYTSYPRDPETDEAASLPVVRIARRAYMRSDAGDAGNHRGCTHQKQRQRHSSSDGWKSRLSHLAPPPTSSRPPGFSPAHEIAFVALICFAQVLNLAGMAQALVPQYLIQRSFPGPATAGDVAWYSAAYGLTAGTLMLPSGRLGDVFGHKAMFVLGWVWFGAWALVGGLAGDVVTRRTSSRGATVLFIVCRALQGAGPALLVPNGQAMLGMAYHASGPRKNLAMCLFGAASPLGFVVGAVLSSVFAQVVGRWEWGFYAMAVACGVFAGLSYFVLPPRPRPCPSSASSRAFLSSSASLPPPSPSSPAGSSKPELMSMSVTTTTTTTLATTSLWTRLDASGSLLGVAGLVLFNFAINQAPIVTWTTPYTYFLLLMGAMLLVAFAYHERRTPHPLVPTSQLSAMTAFALGCTAAGWASFSTWNYYAFSFLQQLRGWSPLLAAGSFAPAPFMGLMASLLTGYLFARAVRAQLILLASMCAFFAGSVLWATAPVGQRYWLNCFVGILVMPFGMNMSNPAASILLSDSLPRDKQGVAASLVVTTVNYSISVALGLAGSAEAAANRGGQDVLAGYRAGQYLGLGFGALGILLACVFLVWSRPGKRASPRVQPQAQELKVV